MWAILPVLFSPGIFPVTLQKVNVMNSSTEVQPATTSQEEGAVNTPVTAVSKNYSPKQEREMSEIYLADPSAGTVAEIAQEYGKTISSVRSKLVSLGIYVKQESKAASSGRITKAQMAASIAGHLFGDESQTQGCENSNGVFLRVLLTPSRVEKYLESLRGSDEG